MKIIYSERWWQLITGKLQYRLRHGRPNQSSLSLSSLVHLSPNVFSVTLGCRTSPFIIYVQGIPYIVGIFPCLFSSDCCTKTQRPASCDSIVIRTLGAPLYTTRTSWQQFLSPSSICYLLLGFRSV